MNRSCPDNSDLSAFTDDELGYDAQVRIGQHLDDCESCRNQVEHLRRLHAQFQSLPALDLGFDLGAQVRAELEERKPSGFWSWRAVPLSLAATLMLTLGVMMGTVLMSPDGGSGSGVHQMALFDALPPGGVCIGFDQCYVQGGI